jgi:hypothetical protein
MDESSASFRTSTLRHKRLLIDESIRPPLSYCAMANFSVYFRVCLAGLYIFQAHAMFGAGTLQASAALAHAYHPTAAGAASH